MHRLKTSFAIASAALLWAAFACAQDNEQTKTYGQPKTPVIVAYVVSALQQGDLANARALTDQYRRSNGDTPEALEALSWLARGEAAAGDLPAANKDALAIEHSAQTALSTRRLDAEPHLALALGAAYEVRADVLNKQGKKSEALQLLRSGMAKWRGTSLVDRFQKNINLLTLQGRPMPLLRETDWIGTKPANPNAWRGKVTLLFFWAHWCADCKAEVPVIAKIAEEFEPKGLAVIAPTRLYGYTAQEENAPPAIEKPFVEKVFAKYYSGIPRVQVPLDTGNFNRFGVSTTPTVVLVDRRGIVQLYHPGVMEETALRESVERLLEPVSASTSARNLAR